MPVEGIIPVDIQQTVSNVDKTTQAALSGLETMVANRRRQAEEMTRIIQAVRMDLQSAREEAAAAQKEAAEERAEAERNRRYAAALAENLRRLHDAFITLVKSVEEACGAGVAVDQRIEAMVLAAETGKALGLPSDITTPRAKDFLAAAGVTPAN